MQSNKTSNQKSKVVDDTVAAPAKHRRKSSSPVTAEAPVPKTMAAAAGAGSASSEVGRSSQVSREEIAQLAHSYWVARGHAGGSAEEDWLRAERELTSKI